MTIEEALQQGDGAVVDLVEFALFICREAYTSPSAGKYTLAVTYNGEMFPGYPRVYPGKEQVIMAAKQHPMFPDVACHAMWQPLSL